MYKNTIYSSKTLGYIYKHESTGHLVTPTPNDSFLKLNNPVLTFWSSSSCSLSSLSRSSMSLCLKYLMKLRDAWRPFWMAKQAASSLKTQSRTQHKIKPPKLWNTYPTSHAYIQTYAGCRQMCVPALNLWGTKPDWQWFYGCFLKSDHWILI